MGYLTIVALDLGKFKSVLCVMDVTTRTHRFSTVESTPAGIRDAVRPLVSSDPAQTLVVFETCDTCGWVHDEVAPLGVKQGRDVKQGRNQLQITSCVPVSFPRRLFG